MSNEIQIGLKLDANTTLEQWAEMGKDIYHEAEGLNWKLADWANFGDTVLGKLKEFCDVNGVDYGKLKSIAKVASRVEQANRIAKLSFAHHAEVSNLPYRQQVKWLKDADAKGMSVPELRREIRASIGDSAAKESDGRQVFFPEKNVFDLHTWLERQPQDFWTPSSRVFWKEKLKPVVTFYESL